jgi:hydrogenase maturation protease
MPELNFEIEDAEPVPFAASPLLALVDRIVNAVLYEGYLLYPYRPSVKNRQRWTFGGLYPRAWSEEQGGVDSWSMQTQCLVQGGANSTLDVTIRFLHLLERRREREERWQEAMERQVVVGELALNALVAQPGRKEFLCPPQPGLEGGREQHAVAGAVELAAEEAGDGLFRVTVRILNETALDATASQAREEALLRSLMSTHTILSVRGGEFVSLIDPPPHWREAAAASRNVGTWPVLVGEEGQKDAMLSSPIILYDYPQIAPESPGDLFDGTEIDEILTLRILTLTDEEKRQAAALDERARALLGRTEALAREQLLRLHGTVRGLRPLEGGPR